LEVKRRGPHVRWTLQSPRATERVNHPFFDRLKQVDISRVLHFVNQHCQFMEAFNHIRSRYVKKEVDNRVITASLIAWGTNMGLGRMGEISDMGYQGLKTTSDNFIRLETLSGANDLVSNAIAQLPIFRHYDIGDVVGAAAIKQISPVAWQHINFYGRYEFAGQPESIDIDAIIKALAQSPLQQTMVV